MLTKDEILNRMNKDIIIKPFNINNLNPNSYNLTLDNELYVYEEDILDVKKEFKTSKIIIPEEGYVLEANKLYIGRSVEYTETYNLVPMIEGRSSIGRMGLFTNCAAGFGDTGYKGKWSIQLYSINKIKIYPNMKIAQLYYMEIVGKPTNYNSKYINSKNDLTSKIYKDFD